MLPDGQIRAHAVTDLVHYSGRIHARHIRRRNITQPRHVGADARPQRDISWVHRRRVHTDP